MAVTEAELLGAEVISLDNFSNCDNEFNGFTLRLKDGRIVSTTMTLWETLKVVEEK